MPNCAVYGCRNTSGRTGNKEKGIYFHQFPKREQSPKRYAEWLKFCNRKSFTPKESSRICSKHFESSDFDESQLLKIRLMPHAKLKGPTLKPGAIPTQINSNEAQNEHRKSIVEEILQNANSKIKPTPIIHTNRKRKSSRKAQSGTKRKVRRNGSIEVQNEKDILKIANENLKSSNSNKGTQCELGIESYRNVMFASGLKSESCSNINLVQSSNILSENIKVETDVVEFYC